MRRLFSSLSAILPSACLALLSAPAMAATSEDEQFWLNLTAMGSVKDELVYFAEVQPRIGDGVSRVDQALFRGALGWKFSPSLTLYQGFAHIVVPTEGGKDVNEERSFQQVSWTLGKPWGGELSSRTRLEQRWRSDGDDMGWRLREMIRYEKPLKAGSDAVNALVYAEGFAALNDTDWGARSGFDQLRSFAGAEIGLPGASTLEVGYLNQLINQRAGNTRVNHVASVTLFFRH
ncbi:DUF2490 domain-containing protein [Sphingobium sp. TCM1]|jgi:hypothetical protein|uniref:DUF2490 domain-containing protein n=1 Tax=Sphingobium sp. TCM1 TaxID=453246 RepID=UPI0007F4C265|nr:DUF2490 domain-containing protein [Sphingobium sp. TCM1]OAN59025.1 hypothetical protein A7Q26_12345 [Sphingobium sp. TCM1]